MLLKKFFSDSDESEEESEEDDDDIDYDQVPSLVNSKLLLDKNNSNKILYFEQVCIKRRVIIRRSKAENLRLGKQA